MKITNIDTFIEEFRNGRDIWSRAAIELAVREIKRLRKRIAELEQERRWIPISERLPEIFGWYLVYGRDASTRRNINVEYFRLNSKTFSGGLHITHWKYLPQPPQEEE